MKVGKGGEKCLVRETIMGKFEKVLLMCQLFKNDTHWRLAVIPHKFMQIHLVDFIKTLLVKNTFIPKFVKMVIQLLGIIVTQYLFNFQKVCLAFLALEHLQEMYLNRIKNGWFHTSLSFSG